MHAIDLGGYLCCIGNHNFPFKRLLERWIADRMSTGYFNTLLQLYCFANVLEKVLSVFFLIVRSLALVSGLRGSLAAIYGIISRYHRLNRT